MKDLKEVWSLNINQNTNMILWHIYRNWHYIKHIAFSSLINVNSSIFRHVTAIHSKSFKLTAFIIWQHIHSGTTPYPICYLIATMTDTTCSNLVSSFCSTTYVYIAGNDFCLESYLCWEHEYRQIFGESIFSFKFQKKIALNVWLVTIFEICEIIASQIRNLPLVSYWTQLKNQFKNFQKNPEPIPMYLKGASTNNVLSWEVEWPQWQTSVSCIIRSF